MRTGINLLFAFLLLACLLGPASNAQTVYFVGAGSSAMWQEFALAAVNDPSINGPGSHHWTTKGACPDKSNCAQAFDSRSGPGGSVSDHQGGNLWVVWNNEGEDEPNAKTRIWAYLSVDSVVGNRLFFATPRATLEIDSNALVTTPNSASGMNLVSSSLFRYGVNSDGNNGCPTTGLPSLHCDDTYLPSAIYDALNNAPITAALTDIRPEDALFASDRVNCPPPIGLGCLGYGISGSPKGNLVKSAFSKSTATPVKYAITGNDPVSGDPVLGGVKFVTYPVGAAPIIILVNRTDAAGLGQTSIKNVTHSQLQTIFSGENCNTSAFGVAGATAHAIYPILREPLSGTMNTFEFTNLTSPTTLVDSQETNVGAHNPLATACTGGGGTRYRAIGTGEVTGAVYDGNETKNGFPIAGFEGGDAIGYVFFSYGNVSKLAASPSYGYLTLDGVDPLEGNPGRETNGELPACVGPTGGAPCPATPNTTFANLRNGNYRSFSFLRLVTTPGGHALELVKAAQANVNLYVPDFVPYANSPGDDGMKVYRSHFPVTVTVDDVTSTFAPNNGLPFADPSRESGGDVGGCIFSIRHSVLGQHENTPDCTK